MALDDLRLDPRDNPLVLGRLLTFSSSAVGPSSFVLIWNPPFFGAEKQLRIAKNDNTSLHLGPIFANDIARDPFPDKPDRAREKKEKIRKKEKLRNL